jgi:hypothetical protein
MKKSKNAQDEAWDLFQEWVMENDPEGDLTVRQQIDKFSKDTAWHERKYEEYRTNMKPGEHDIMDQFEGGVRTELHIDCTPENVEDINKLVGNALKVGRKVKPGETISLAYGMNLSLDGFIPKDKPQMLDLLTFLTQHPLSLRMSEQQKEQVMSHLERSLREAEMWYGLVAKVTRDFARIFIKQHIAKKKASKNEVSVVELFNHPV